MPDSRLGLEFPGRAHTGGYINVSMEIIIEDKRKGVD